MIVKMSKYSFIVLSRELNDFLEGIQQLGIVDITRSTKAIDEESKKMMNLIKRYQSILAKLDGIKPNESPAITEDIPKEEILFKIEEYFYRKSELTADISAKSRALKDALPWEDFSNEDISRIHSLGYKLKFYVVSDTKFKEEWKSEYALQILNKIGGKTYFVIIYKDAFDFSIQEAKFPEIPCSQLKQEIDSAIGELALIEQRIAGSIKYKEDLEGKISDQLTILDNYFATKASINHAENTLSILEGFAPTEDTAKIESFLDKNGILYLKDKACVEDNPPIQLKNNWFARLFEPIGNLYTLPNYGDLDLTPYFAPFYMLFFGFCMGDMGYGLIFLIAGIVLSLKPGTYRDYGKLLVFLGTCTIIMPALTGTFFGLKLYEVFNLPENVNNFFFSDIKLFWFGILFGIFQIVFARIIKTIFAFSRKMWSEGLAEIGWATFIIWGTFAYAGVETGKTFIPDPIGKIIMWSSLALIVLFNSPSKNPIARIFKGTASLYDITGVFGDVLSYIRLFGLATSGGILGMVVNSMASQAGGVPIIGPVITIIILLLGHTLVLGLSTLGAFVHPMRLTFVEFYKNAGFGGGGRAFNPFKKNN